MKRNIYFIAFLFLLCSCGTRRTTQIPYNASINVTENGRVGFETPVVTPQVAVQPAFAIQSVMTGQPRVGSFPDCAQTLVLWTSLDAGKSLAARPSWILDMTDLQSVKWNDVLDKACGSSNPAHTPQV